MSGLTLGTTYEIKVTSVNEIGESDDSVIISSLFANAPSEPATVTLTASSTPSLLVEWTAPSSVNGDSVQGYYVYIDDGEGGEYTLVYDGST